MNTILESRLQPVTDMKSGCAWRPASVLRWERANLDSYSVLMALACLINVLR